MTITSEQVNVIVGGLILVIGAVTAAAVKIIKAVKTSGRAITAEQSVSKARGKLRDQKIHDIHLLVNSRLTVALRLLVVLTKKEAERTRNPEDVAAYQEAVEEMARAAEATKLVEQGIGLEEDAANEVVQAEAVAAFAKEKAL